MSVLIDPYMFELSDADEIKNNLTFFFKIIELGSISDNQKRITIAISKDMLQRMYNRAIQPFPIKMESITDSDLKNTIMQINALFNKMLLGAIEEIDIGDCEGGQKFKVDDERIMEDDNYYEMLFTLLIPCYSSVDIDDRILTGKKTKGRQEGDSITIRCICSAKEYEKKFRFVLPEEFVSVEDRAKRSLKEKMKRGEIPILEIIEATMGSHHNHVQNDGRRFTKLNDLSLKNKRVLRQMAKFGLSKVIFGRFSSNVTRPDGTMEIQRVRNTQNHDIVVVNFYAETGYQIETDLYFPIGVGNLLNDYFHSDLITYCDIMRLVETVSP